MIMKNDFTIRWANPSDVPLIFDFIKQLAEYEKMSPDVVATEELLAENLFGSKPSAEVLLGYEDEVAVGFALFFTNFSTFVGRPGLYLEDLFVVPEKRGRGYGKALLEELIKIAKQRNYGRVEWSVLDWNKPAIDFYLSMGAKPMDEWTVYRLNNEIINRY
jgi:GNAT superfamily N-acetyltransferase